MELFKAEHSMSKPQMIFKWSNDWAAFNLVNSCPCQQRFFCPRHSWQQPPSSKEFPAGLLFMQVTHHGVVNKATPWVPSIYIACFVSAKKTRRIYKLSWLKSLWIYPTYDFTQWRLWQHLLTKHTSPFQNSSVVVFSRMHSESPSSKLWTNSRNVHKKT